MAVSDTTVANTGVLILLSDLAELTKRVMPSVTRTNARIAAADNWIVMIRLSFASSRLLLLEELFS